MALSKYRLRQGDTIGVVAASSQEAILDGSWRILYDDGALDIFTLIRASTGTTRVREYFSTDGVAKRAGEIVSGVLRSPASGLNRGEVYAQMLSGRKVGEGFPSIDHNVIGQSYVYDMSPSLLGVFIEPGPGGGEGNVRPITVAASEDGDVNTSFPMAASNAHRRFDAAIIYYHCDGTVVNRTWVTRIRDRGLGVPTGFDAGNDRQIQALISPTLSADEDGILYQNRFGYQASVDQSVITLANNTTASNPFPFWVMESDGAEFFIDITNGAAGDKYSAYLFGEEWILLS